MLFPSWSNVVKKKNTTIKNEEINNIIIIIICLESFKKIPQTLDMDLLYFVT